MNGMNFETFITDKLRNAEQQEILDGESGIVADLVDAFSVEHIREGVSVIFGGDRNLFSQALEILGLQDTLKRGGLVINDISVNTQGARSHCTQSLGEWVKNANDLATTLDYMQAVRWGTLPQENEYTQGKVTPEDIAITSYISALHTTLNDEGTMIVDATRPMVAVRATYVYEPAIYNKDTLEDFDLRGYIAKRRSNSAALPKELSENVDEFFSLEDADLSLPTGSYSLVISPVAQTSYAFEPLVPATPYYRYRLDGGRIKEKPSTSY